MYETPSTITISPCDPCIRIPRENRQSVAVVELGAKHLIWTAADDAGDVEGEALNTPTSEELGKIYYGSDKEVSRYFSAVGICALRIAKGACLTWQYDPDTHQIVPRSVEA